MLASNAIRLSPAILLGVFLASCGGDGGPTPCAPEAEVCDGADNDCDGQVDEGLGTVSCGLGICLATVPACVDGSPGQCVPGPADPSEGCDGVDDDCDGEVDEDCDCIDGHAQACFTGGEAARGVGACHDGEQLCAGGAWGACAGEQLPVEEICNGVDDDCDATADEDDPGGGGVCDTGLLGACASGTLHCQGGGLLCVEDVEPAGEVCNGIDDDCDGAADEGNPGGGVPCDGADSDLCAEGVTACTGGALVCTDSTGSTLDLCNGADDDCDAASADGSEDPLLGQACDGPDSDLCLEGTRFCSGGALACTDNTASTIDACNGLNDDCDAASPDGSEDPLLGQACDGADGDLCLEGTRTCAGGQLVCTDGTGTTVELCVGNGADEDCDGSVDEGFVRSDNPTCAGGTYFLGSVDGDAGSQVITDAHYSEEWDRATIRENSSSLIYVSATVRLYSPPGVDFDLYVYCASCGGTLAGSSAAGGLTGHYDTVNVRSDETFAIDDTFDIVIEVRHFNSSLCAYWTLEVQGNTTVTNETCG